MSYADKVTFLQTGLVLFCESLPAGANGHWGKMNAQQMVEHVADFFDVSAEKIKFDLITPEEQLPKFKAFLLSDKDFRENTKAPVSVVSEEPVPLRNASMAEATGALQNSVAGFFSFFEKYPERKTVHPVFGPLDQEEWVLLHTKHVQHHLRQFGWVKD
jgi:oxepin-CoA hydrolase/3-oxo-5,6-dehydrosuberyl-CoA semialdehyde dehydrogenase